MSKHQSYVSSELTHFVGQKMTSEEEQYTLFTEIIMQGVLRGKLDHPRGSTHILMDPNIDFSTNKSYNPNMVCFCDIPVSDLQIHMSKYSHFGIAFSKDFLIRQGARPVFYIPYECFCVNEKVSDLFDRSVRNLNEIHFYSLIPWLAPVTSEGNTKTVNAYDPALQSFIDQQLLSFVKFFDHSKEEDDPDNFYMEREWRSLERIEFSLENVERIIIPASFVHQFFKDFPDYNRHISTV